MVVSRPVEPCNINPALPQEFWKYRPVPPNPVPPNLSCVPRSSGRDGPFHSHYGSFDFVDAFVDPSVSLVHVNSQIVDCLCQCSNLVSRCDHCDRTSKRGSCCDCHRGCSWHRRLGRCRRRGRGCARFCQLKQTRETSMISCGKHEIR